MVNTGAAAECPGLSAAAHWRITRAWHALESVEDPEIPSLSIVDLGIVRSLAIREDSSLDVRLSPTYSGCPATEVIRASVRATLDAHGFADAVLDEVLAPPWSSDWLSAEGREKLRAYGIAPPAHALGSPRGLWRAPRVSCPRCASADTERISEFGSTPCKAHYRCRACAEPFDYFKCI